MAVAKRETINECMSLCAVSFSCASRICGPSIRHCYVRFWTDWVHQIEIHSSVESKMMPLWWLWFYIKFHLSLLPASFSLSIPCISICSSARSCTASLRGSVTCMCHCWTGCMSTTPLNTRVASSCARTTAPTKLSSSRCEPSTLPRVEPVGGEAAKGEERWDLTGWEDGVKGKRGRGEKLPDFACQVESLRRYLGRW